MATAAGEEREARGEQQEVRCVAVLFGVVGFACTCDGWIYEYEYEQSVCY